MELKILFNRKTGKFHRGYQNNNPLCNQRGNSRIPQYSAATDIMVMSASEGAFCAKCFPDGKPTVWFEK